MEVEVGAELCFPQLLNTSCRKPTSPWPETLLIHIVLSFISLLTVALNLLVIITVSHFRQLQAPTNLPLLSLAVSDFLLGFVMIPVEILRQLHCWFFGDLLCSLYNNTSLIVTSASVGNMVLISVDRYVAICDPLHYTTRITVNRVKVCVCLCWFYSVFYNSLIIRDDLTQTGRYNSCHGDCMIVFGYTSGAIDIILTFIIPITVIIVLYMRVFVVAVSQARTMRSHVAAAKLSQTLMTKKSELKAARTLGVVVVVYLICFCPYYCISLVPDSLFTSVSHTTFVLFLLCFNPCLNPVIYASFYSWFRKAIRLIVTFQILQPGSRETNIL